MVPEYILTVSRLCINSGRILVYTADVSPLNDPAAYDSACRQVPEYRRQKADRYRFMKDRCLSLGAGLLLRRACADLGISGADEHILYGEQEKPAFAEHPEVHFNLSHSGTTAMCAVASEPVGCDVEQVRDCDLALAQRFFHPEEYEYLLSVPQQERSKSFTRLWTMKESYIKCTGKGLAQSLQEFSVVSATTVQPAAPALPAASALPATYALPAAPALPATYALPAAPTFSATTAPPTVSAFSATSAGSDISDEFIVSPVVSNSCVIDRHSFCFHQWFDDSCSYAVCSLA